jgi:hypothetical protein
MRKNGNDPQRLQAPVHPKREEKPWLEYMERLTRLEKQAPLSAYQPAGQCHKERFIDKDRNITSEYSEQNPPANNGRHGKKNQNPQPSAYIHERQPPVHSVMFRNPLQNLDLIPITACKVKVKTVGQFAGWPVCRFARLPVCPFAGWPVCRFARLPVGRFARLPVCRFKKDLSFPTG